MSPCRENQEETQFSGSGRGTAIDRRDININESDSECYRVVKSHRFAEKSEAEKDILTVTTKHGVVRGRAITEIFNACGCSIFVFLHNRDRGKRLITDSQ